MMKNSAKTFSTVYELKSEDITLLFMGIHYNNTHKDIPDIDLSLFDLCGGEMEKLNPHITFEVMPF